MLTELRITDFAIVDSLELRFDGGLITFTGETGAGKSIIIDAVEAVVGGRVDSSLVRAGAQRAVVEADFHLGASVREPVLAILEREDLLDGDEFVSLTREIRLQGRSLARINGRSVNVNLLKEIGEYLVDVHGQSEHLSLLRTREHRRLLDGFAGAEAALNRYTETYQELRQVQKDLDSLRQLERDSVRRAELLEYQTNEIEAAAPVLGEEEVLKQERDRLANAESLATLAQTALAALEESVPESPAANELLGQAIEALNHLARLDPWKAGLRDQFQEALDLLADAAVNLRDYSELIEFNPRRLDAVEERLSLLYNLQRKYGDGLERVLEFGAQARRDLEDITHAEERLAELADNEHRLLIRLGEYGATLSAARKTAAGQMGRALEVQLKDLRMAGARFEVEFEQTTDPQGAPSKDGVRVAYGPYGLETLQFLVAPNPGEGLKPIVKIASGGEMSRLMLALKNVLAQADPTPTLIFDEIDQGIGGRVGAVVGEKLWRLARRHQVMCITHLPQLAAYSQQHYHVSKRVHAGRTTTVVESLDSEKRLKELAQMLGDVSEGTLQSAREMVAAVRTLEKPGSG